MKLGIVGLPNVGKSTLFNSLTKAGAAAAFGPLGGALISGATGAVTGWIKGEKGFGNAVKNFAFGAGLSVLGNGTASALTSASLKGIKAGAQSAKSSFGRGAKFVRNLVKGKGPTKGQAWKKIKKSFAYARDRNRRRSNGHANWQIKNGLAAFYSGKYGIYWSGYRSCHPGNRRHR